MIEDTELPLRMFRFMARHGLLSARPPSIKLRSSCRPSSRRERNSGAIRRDSSRAPCRRGAADHAFAGLLTALLPEFAVIDSLVIRDYSHRFTVDEHSFVAIENLHALRKAQSKWDRGFAELLDELSSPTCCI